MSHRQVDIHKVDAGKTDETDWNECTVVILCKYLHVLQLDADCKQVITPAH